MESGIFLRLNFRGGSGFFASKPLNFHQTNLLGWSLEYKLVALDFGIVAKCVLGLGYFVILISSAAKNWATSIFQKKAL